MSLVVGLTGGISSGKSMVADLFKERNIKVVDADLIAREVVEPGTPAYQKIVEVFGEEILYEDETINRKKLGNIIFSKEDKRIQLNQIVHPAVREKMIIKRDELISSGEPIIVMDIPLLFESKLTSFVDKVIVVYVSEETQLTRLMKRDNSSREEALGRIHSQIPISEKANLADEVIDNNGSVQETEMQLELLLKKWNISFN